MGFEILPIKEGDEDSYDIITITSPEKWVPHRFQKHSEEILPYDPTDMQPEQEKHDYPAVLKSYIKVQIE